MFFQPKNLKSENNDPWFNILLHTQSIVCATVDRQCLEYLGYITLVYILRYSIHFIWSLKYQLFPGKKPTAIIGVILLRFFVWSKNVMTEKSCKTACHNNFTIFLKTSDMTLDTLESKKFLESN